MSTTSGRWRGSNNAYRRGGATRPGVPRGAWVNQLGRRPLDVERPPSPPLGDLVARIDEDELVQSSDSFEASAKITDCEDVTSYNWLNREQPTILIPGKPPAWTPLSSPIQLQQDDGKYYRDENAARYPPHPFQPAVEAILTEHPHFPTTDIDIVACGSTLGNLIRFVRKHDKPFRMLVEVIGSTVFFVRRENSPTELISNVYGFGHTFPEMYTTWTADVKGSESHQRVLRYRFGGLQCLVRFEADGYHPELLPQGIGKSTHVENVPVQIQSSSSLSSALADTTIKTRPSTDPEGGSLTIVQAGEKVPQAAVFDLKTRSIRKQGEDILGEELPRLWIAQIPNFVLAYHRSGMFEDIQIRDVQDEVQRWELDNEVHLRQFAQLLTKLVSFARGWEDGRFELRRAEGSQTLELRKQCDDVGRALPTHLHYRWITQISDGHQSPAAESPLSPPDWNEDALEWDEGSEKDFTACSADTCGYCGHCEY